MHIHTLDKWRHIHDYSTWKEKGERRTRYVLLDASIEKEYRQTSN